MAAPMLVTCLQPRVYQSFVRFPWARSLHSSALICAGQEWRIKHGFARSGSEYGPLTDLPDWSFADGRPAPPWKGQSRRKEENKELASRIVMLSNEIDQGMKNWAEKQENLKQQQLLKQKNQLKPKAIFKKSSKS
ncbi:39S ribosomal protein L52, mitochondrial [Hyla sarda]|uniref:39S ribosomal protein L52, mitochondrial n=1 Tax=Hyla sarda TaxID=327740 RepID=UPI0024C44B59|nr:39S ribosomal protein L52, mitochondrial [Hyla sarda]